MKSHVTVIPSDSFIAVDGQGLFLEFPKPAGIHAIQWHNGAGHVEYAKGAPNAALTAKEYATAVAPYVALWQAEKDRLEAEADRPPTLEEARAAAVAAVKEKSWRVETAGILVQGTRIPTDRESQALLTGAVVDVMLNPDAVTRWQTGSETPDGTPLFITLSGTELKLIAQAVRAHVQACFDAREAKCAALATLDSVEEIEAWLADNLETGWPATAPPVASEGGPEAGAGEEAEAGAEQEAGAEPEAAGTPESWPEPAPLIPPVTAVA